MNKRAAGLDRTSVLTIQQRTYARLHRRIRWALRRQVRSLPHPRAEMGHPQRVSAELIKEMAIDGHAVDAQHVSEHLGEDAFGAGRRGAAPICNQHRFSQCPSTMTCAKCSSHGLVEEVGQAQLLAAGDRLVVHPLADREVEYPKAERRENDRTATID